MNVTPVSRKCKKELPGTYRLISLPSIPGKVLEQLILNHVKFPGNSSGQVSMASPMVMTGQDVPSTCLLMAQNWDKYLISILIPPAAT